MFERALSRHEITPGVVNGIDIRGQRLAFYDLNGEILATTDICAHAGCLLSISGDIYDRLVECSCHGSGFDIQTGKNIQPPSADPLRTYKVRVDGSDVLVDLD